MTANNSGKVVKTWLQGWATSYRMKGGEEMLHKPYMIFCLNENFGPREISQTTESSGRTWDMFFRCQDAASVNHVSVSGALNCALNSNEELLAFDNVAKSGPTRL